MTRDHVAVDAPRPLSTDRKRHRSSRRAGHIDHRRSADEPGLARGDLGRALLLRARWSGATRDRRAVRDRAGVGDFARHPALIAQHHALLDLRHAARVASERLLAGRRRVGGSLRGEVARHHHRFRMAGDRQQHGHRNEDDVELRQATTLRRNVRVVSAPLCMGFDSVRRPYHRHHASIPRRFHRQDDHDVVRRRRSSWHRSGACHP